MTEHTQPIDVKTGIQIYFQELLKKYSQIAFLVDMEGVVLPHGFSNIVSQSIQGSVNEEKAIKRAIKSLDTNTALLETLQKLIQMASSRTMVVSTIHRVIKNKHEISSLGEILDLGTGKDHDLLYRTFGGNYYGKEDPFTIEKNSLAMNLVYKTGKHSKTTLNFLQKHPDVNFSTLDFMKIKLPIFKTNGPEYEQVFYEAFNNELRQKPYPARRLPLK